MNKKGFWKVLMVTLVMASAIGLLASRAIAQNIPTQLMLSDDYGVQVGGTVLLDNFQYWNSPRDMGWEAFEPSYPVFGAGLGLGTMETIVDFQEGSRVMEVFSVPSTFMPMGGNVYNPYTITKDAKYRSGNVELTGIPGLFSTMSLQVKAPLSVEWFDTFRVIVRVRVMANTNAVLSNVSGMIDTNADGTPDQEVPLGAAAVCGTAPNLGLADIVFVPRETQVGCTPSNVLSRIYQVDKATSGAFLGSFVSNSPETSVYAANGQLINGSSPAAAWVALGREFQDGSWHLVMEDLQTIIGGLTSNSESIFEIVSVTVRGNQYRMDDLMFTAPAASIANNNAPYLFRIGPVYGQLFNTGIDQNRFVYAEDTDYIWLLSDRALLWKAQDDEELAQQLSSLPAGCILATRLAAAANSTVADYPFIEDNSGRTPATTGFVAAEAHFINPFGLPPVAPAVTPALFTGVTPPELSFTFTVGDTLGPQTIIGRPITVVPAAAITADYVMNQLPSMLPCMNAPTSTWLVNTNSTTGYNPMYAMACALANSGFANWPTVQVLTPTLGQVLEDQIITCRVDDGLATDMETFPVSVVNYPVTNVPPLIEQLEDRFFQVGSQSVYQITATDPDPEDMAGGLTYRATLNGLSSYQYGPWMEQIINPITGTITITPQFEATMTCIVTVIDPRGAQAVGHFNIFCVNSGTWLNHAPSVLEIIESPQICRAGERFTISDLRIADPDGQSLYYSCNIGSVGAGGIWTFQSEYPGEYLVQITAYDIVGGAVTQQFVLQVMPWWSI